MLNTYYLIDKSGSKDIGQLSDNSAFEGIYENEFPIEFTNVLVKMDWAKYCFSTSPEYLVTYMVLNGDFYEKDAYLNQAVSDNNFINYGARPYKYHYLVCASRRFRIWSTDFDRNKVVSDSFQMMMLLNWKTQKIQ